MPHVEPEAPAKGDRANPRLARRSLSAIGAGKDLKDSIRCSALCLLICAGAARADWRDEIGYTALARRLGGSLPSGRTIRISQVEMPFAGDGDYLPDRDDAQLAGKTINGQSGAGGISNHATLVGRYCAGLTTSIGPGIRQIDLYEANNWAGAGLLNVNTNRPPGVEPRPVQNHSWIGSFGSRTLDADALRRIDWVVERDGVLVAAGVRNGEGTPIPHLMCSAYNVIAVGLSNGRSSRGPTDIDTSGRIKPDIVVPVSATSWATPVVASSAALLLEAIEARGDPGRLNPGLARSARPLLIKALLMGGAVKSPWADWHRGFEASSSRHDVPLDCRYGAGQLNIDRSYRILEAGRQTPDDAAAAHMGWDCNRVTPRSPQRYRCQLAHEAQTVSILLTWHRRVGVASERPLILSAAVANIDLRLYREADTGAPALVDQSCSRVDNVEHLHLKNLPAGAYAMEVTTDAEWDYAMTWDFRTAADDLTSPALFVQTPADVDTGLGRHARPDQHP